MAKWKVHGSFNRIQKFLNRLEKKEYLNVLDALGDEGVQALAAATPKDTGLTAASWKYEIEHDKETTRISWYNTNINNGVPIAIILQYGHATGTGGFVQGQDYINPAMKPIFDKISREVWREVTRS